MAKISIVIGTKENEKKTSITIDNSMELKYDLRLGNQVQQGEIIQLEPEWVIVKANKYETKGFIYDLIKPIELNESNLMHGLGFKQATDRFEGYLAPTPKPTMMISHTELDTYIIDSSMGIIEFEYVHQLQNLYQEIFKKRLIWL